MSPSYHHAYIAGKLSAVFNGLKKYSVFSKEKICELYQKPVFIISGLPFILTGILFLATYFYLNIQAGWNKGAKTYTPVSFLLYDVILFWGGIGTIFRRASGCIIAMSVCVCGLFGCGWVLSVKRALLTDDWLFFIISGLYGFFVIISLPVYWREWRWL